MHAEQHMYADADYDLDDGGLICFGLVAVV